MLRIIIAGALALALGSELARAQSNPQFIAFPGIAKGALYRPDAGPAPHVGILAMHRTANYLNHRACTELSRRGFLMLCMNTRYENNEAQVDFEKLPLDVKAGVAFLRRQPGITKVILFAHSGGGPLMSFYQAVAEHGPAYCKGPNKLTECGDDLAGLPPADGIVFADAHPGNAINTLRSLNAAVANENNPPDAPPVAALNMFDPANGYNPHGASHYSAEFQARYFKAQAERMNRLIAIAQDKLARIKRKDYPYPDDDIMLIPRGGNPGAGAGADARLFVTQPDIAAINSTVRPVKLLRNDGSIATQIVRERVRGRSVGRPHQPAVPHRHQNFYAALVSERPGGARQRCRRGYRFLLDQQFDDLRGAIDLGAGDVCRHGRPLLHPRQRAPVRYGGEPRQGFCRDRGRDPRLCAVHAMRDAPRPIFQHG